MIASKLYAPIIALSLSCINLATPANAATCGGTADFYATLTTDHNESPVWVGATNDGAMIEVWANSQTQSWTVMISNRGVSCLVAAGVGFASMPIGEAL
jgi:hypothetical protein